LPISSVPTNVPIFNSSCLQRVNGWVWRTTTKNTNKMKRSSRYDDSYTHTRARARYSRTEMKNDITDADTVRSTKTCTERVKTVRFRRRRRILCFAFERDCPLTWITFWRHLEVRRWLWWCSSPWRICWTEKRCSFSTEISNNTKTNCGKLDWEKLNKNRNALSNELLSMSGGQMFSLVPIEISRLHVLITFKSAHR